VAIHLQGNGRVGVLKLRKRCAVGR
jgi:hypothetical protein